MLTGRWFVIVLAVAVIGAAFVFGINAMNQRLAPPIPLGVQPNGGLAECPATPNCVSTTATGSQAMDPLPAAAGEASLEALKGVVLSMPRSKIVNEQSGYFHAEFRSWLFGFVDDVEFLLDADASKIHFRSASRLGRSDLGVNRGRMEEIRRRYLSRGPSATSNNDNAAST